jgi:hypothetical protein
MGLTGARVAERNDVLARQHVLAARQFEHQHLVQRGDGGEVERVEALARREGTVRNFVFWPGGWTFLCCGSCEALTEQDGELGFGHGPLTRRHDPFFLGLVQDVNAGVKMHRRAGVKMHQG